MTKYQLFTVLSLLIFTVACEKPSNLTNYEKETSVQLNVGLSFEAKIETKVANQLPENEKKINNFQIFVFRTDENNALDACASSGFSGTVSDNLTLTCTTGNREVWALVNYYKDLTKDSRIGTKEALLKEAAEIQHYSPNKLLMLGHKDPSLFTPGSHDLSVNVEHYFSSVILESIKNDMQAFIYQAAGRFRLKKAYLTNVVGRGNLEKTLTPGSVSENEWYGKNGPYTDNALFYDDLGTIDFAYNTTYSTKHTFYCFPNNCASSTDEAWSPRATRLVIEAEYYDGINWHTCYYPINLDTNGGLKANTKYTVRLTIKRPGSTDPNKPVEFDTITGLVDILDWETGTSYQEVI